MRQLEQLLKRGVTYIANHPELLFTLVLIVVIPFAFLFSADQFLSVSTHNQERLEKDRIGLMHDLFGQLIMTSQDPEVIQENINAVTSQNPDITKFRVVLEDKGVYIPVAALNPDVVGVAEEDSGFYRKAYSHEGESLLFPIHTSLGRAWQGVRVFDFDNETYYVFTETSLASLDALFATRIQVAYYWLFGLLAIVLILVLRHVRLIDYGYLYRETKRANEARDLFTNMITHELRAPLTAMRGYASMIRENESVSNEVREQGRRIEDSAERLVLIVNDLLDVARIQSGRMKFEKEETDMSQIVREVLEAQRPVALQKGIELTHSGTEEQHTIQIDPKRMTQALTNLVNNALKYTKEGSIEVVLTDKKDRLELRVKDTGMGISSEDQKGLFAPFFRAKENDPGKITGTGLGMWITKQFVELMGASIGVESIKSVGTHVVVTIPKS